MLEERDPLVQIGTLTRATVERDDEGLFVTVGGRKFRPGTVKGYEKRFDMRDGGLKEGSSILTTTRGFNDLEDYERWKRDNDLRKISSAEGGVYWHAEGEKRNKGLMEHPKDGSYTREGMRHLFIDEDKKGLFVAVRSGPMTNRSKDSMREIHRLSKADSARFEKGQTVSLNWTNSLISGSVANIRSEATGQSATLKLDRDPAAEPLIDRTRQKLATMTAMASGIGR